ncbi:MAG: prenyltransferase, partial [Chloroflexi bacterium]|nr:prenyltransferase [Chloroflexota bacterium]
MGLIGVLSGYFYTAPPFKLVFRGIGELFIALDFGILLTVGSFFVQTGYFALEPLVASLPIAMLVAGILYINEFQDYKADKEVGKNHLVARMGRKRAAVGYSYIMWLTYAFIVIGVILGLISP